MYSDVTVQILFALCLFGCREATLYIYFSIQITQ